MTKQVQQVLQLTYKWYTMLVGQAEGKGGGRRSKVIESAREQRAREGAIDVADILPTNVYTYRYVHVREVRDNRED